MSEPFDSSELGVADLWPAPEPPPDFIERVMAARAVGAKVQGPGEAAGAAPRRGFGRWAAVAFVLLVLGGGLGLRAWRGARGGDTGRAAAGQVVAATRTSAAIGARARAVAEAGSELVYAVAASGAARVTQRRGDVFYRVDAGGPFTVVTAAGEVRVKGTCFRVVVGGAQGARVMVYEGEVVIVNDRGEAAVGPGEGGVVPVGAAPQLLREPGPAVSGAPAAANPPLAAARVRAPRARSNGVALPRSPALGEPTLEPAALAWDAPGFDAPARVRPRPQDVTIKLRFVAGAAVEGPDADGDDQARAPVFAAYAARLRRQISARWQPLAGLRGQVPGGRAALGDLRQSTLRVRVDRGGRAVSVTLEGPSGLSALDQAAEAALAQAAPLPPPPHEALDDDGELELHFEFHVDFGAAAYLARLGREVEAAWRPPVAFQRIARPGAVTAVRVLLTPAGIIAAAALEDAAGVGPLDRSALAALAPGVRLPSPPPALRLDDGRAALRFVFVPDVTGQGRVRVERAAAAPSSP